MMYSRRMLAVCLSIVAAIVLPLTAKAQTVEQELQQIVAAQNRLMPYS